MMKQIRKQGRPMLKPTHLSKGDTVGIIAPAGPIQAEKLTEAIPFLEGLGLHVIVGQHVYERNDFIAGTDEERAQDFHDMIENPNVRAIFCARGGYGTGRIASMLDYKCIRKNPKIIWGYSDITYLHTAIRQQAGLITFHGPMIASDVSSEKFDAQSAQSFEQLFHAQPVTYDETISPLRTIAKGEGKGPLVGGNLSVFMSTMGTPYEIDTTGAILLMEDIGEDPYQVDGLCNQLKQSGKLEKLAGIAIGDFRPRDLDQTERSTTYDSIFQHYFKDLHIPVVAGFQIGHCFPNIGIPLGTEATLSTETKQLHIEQGVQ